MDELLRAEPLPPLDEIISTLLATAERYLAVQLRLAVQVWGEALCNSEFADIVKSLYGAFRERFVEVAQRPREEGQLHVCVG